MEEQRFKFCLKEDVCNKSGLSKRILKLNGCTKHSSCEEFIQKIEKIKEKMLLLKNYVCLKKKCTKEIDIKKINLPCLDCRNLVSSTDSNSNKIEVLARCVDEYCSKCKNILDLECIDCEKCRLFNDKIWVEFRGGKDLKGNNF
jgi:hypothetical protein